MHLQRTITRDWLFEPIENIKALLAAEIQQHAEVPQLSQGLRLYLRLHHDPWLIELQDGRKLSEYNVMEGPGCQFRVETKQGKLPACFDSHRVQKTFQMSDGRNQYHEVRASQLSNVAPLLEQMCKLAGKVGWNKDALDKEIEAMRNRFGTATRGTKRYHNQSLSDNHCRRETGPLVFGILTLPEALEQHCGGTYDRPPLDNEDIRFLQQNLAYVARGPVALSPEVEAFLKSWGPRRLPSSESMKTLMKLRRSLSSDAVFGRPVGEWAFIMQSILFLENDVSFLNAAWSDQLWTVLLERLRGYRIEQIHDLRRRGGSEAMSRTVIDNVLLPLCIKLDLWLEPEQPNGDGSKKRPDYVIHYKDHQVIGTVEAKRCQLYPGELLSDGIGKSVKDYMPHHWRRNEASMPNDLAPSLISVVTDGFHWVFVKVGQQGLGISSVICMSSATACMQMLQCLASHLLEVRQDIT